MLLSKYWYYLKSAAALFSEFENPSRITAIFLGRPGALPAEIRLRRSGWRFKVRSAMDVWVIKETCVDADYVWAVGALQPDWNVVDIGAGLGDFTVYAAKHCPRGTIHAYEPLPDSYALLQHNLRLNDVGADSAQTFPLAAAATSGMLVPEDVKREAVSTRFVSELEGSIVVDAIDLKQVLDAIPGGQCDFMKIDCEGCEFDLILNSPADVLGRVRRISMEYHNGMTVYNSSELVDYLTSLGFNVRTQTNAVHDYLGFLYAEKGSSGPA